MSKQVGTYIKRCDLNPAIRRGIERKEKELGRICRRIWKHTNPGGDTYLFGSYCKNWDRMVVTVGYLHPSANIFITPR